MAVPKLAAFDAKGFSTRLKAAIGDFAVFDQFVDWKKSVDSLRDSVAANAIFTRDVKRDLDDFRENVGVAHVSFDRRLDALEAASSNAPFPSGSS